MRFIIHKSIIFIIILLTQYTNILASNDVDFFNYINAKNWSGADYIARNRNDNILIKILKIQKFLDINSQSSFEEITDFINNNPKYPYIDKLKIRAEECLNYNTNKAKIIKWFNKNKPLTSSGFKFYALAAHNLIFDETILKNIAINGFIYGNFSKEELKKYITLYKPLITQREYIARIDDLLMQSKIKEAKELIHNVSKSYHNSFLAQIEFIQGNCSSANKIFGQINPNYYTQGLIFRYLDSHKKDIPTHHIVNLFNRVKKVNKHNNQWTKLQLYYAREFLSYKKFGFAYEVLNHDISSETVDIVEREWLAGFVALRLLHKPKSAITHFHKLNNTAKLYMSKARANYWLARSYEALGDKTQPKFYYAQASTYPYTFYGQVALVEIGSTKLLLPEISNSNITKDKEIKYHDLIQATKLVARYGNYDMQKSYIENLINSDVAQNSTLISIINQIQGKNKIHYITSYAKTAMQRGKVLRNLAFPTPYNINNKPVESALTYAIIRQESVFNQSAVSCANAYGLMQLIKSTACDTAKKIGLRCSVNKLIEDYRYNITLGTQHLRDLLDQYSGSYILTAIAYNAGPNPVNKWVSQNEDPRVIKNVRHVIDWIEMIPYGETRNYVQRILENVQIYRVILSNNNKLQLKQDLLKNN